MCCKFVKENSYDFKMATPDFFARHFISFFIEMNNKLTYWPTFTEMTNLIVSKIWFLITVLLMLLLT